MVLFIDFNLRYNITKTKTERIFLNGKVKPHLFNQIKIMLQKIMIIKSATTLTFTTLNQTNDLIFE